MIDLKGIHHACYKAIGGEDSPAVQSHREAQRIELVREEFFDRSLWAIWVAGMKVKVVEGIKQKSIEICSFPAEWEEFARWDQPRFDRFINCMGTGPRGLKKWRAIKSIADWLDELGSDEAFQRDLFKGKTAGRELDYGDVVRLLDRRFSFIGLATAQFIIRMLGGNIIKDDVVVQAFRNWRGWTYDELCREVDNAGIPRGDWDCVIWKYHEIFVKQTKNLPTHFNQEFARYL